MPYLYYNMSVRITIADHIVFDVVNSVKIEDSIEKLSATASLELPREFRNAISDNESYSLKGENLLSHIKPGDSIKIELGYDGELGIEFEGYITEVGAEIPTVLKCEDEMYLFRKGKLINKTFPSVKLRELLEFIAPGYEVVCPDMNLGKITIENATPYKVMERIKSDYGIRSFFKGKVLHAGMPIEFEPKDVHEFNFNRNIRKSSSLVYKTKDGREMYIKAVSMQKGGGKVHYETGTPGESEVTLHGPINLSQKELKSWTDLYLQSKVYDGFEGTLDSWGLPRTKPGDSAELTDPNYPDGHRDGKYFIESVTISLNADSGFKRSNNLSFKLK